jgi:hypothetical protein
MPGVFSTLKRRVKQAHAFVTRRRKQSFPPAKGPSWADLYAAHLNQNKEFQEELAAAPKQHPMFIPSPPKQREDEDLFANPASLLRQRSREEKHIAIILIRAHGSIPYDWKLSNSMNKPVADIIAAPKGLNVLKITSALNGAPNCGLVRYDTKYMALKEAIQQAQTLSDTPMGLAYFMQTTLRNKERGKFDDFQTRNMISHGPFLNKLITPYESTLIANRAAQTNDFKYHTLTLWHYDTLRGIVNEESIYDQVKKWTLEQNEWINADAGYPVIPPHEMEQVRTLDLLNYMKENTKFKDVILLDFSCSSADPSYFQPHDVDEMVRDLNEKHIHGGKPKPKRMHKHQHKHKTTRKQKHKPRY